MSDDILALENQLCFALYAASHAFTKAYKPRLAELGLTYPQYLTMLVLWERRVASVGEIGAALGLDSGTLSPLLKRLEKAGLIRRERSQKDERQVAIHLTPNGAAMKKQAMSVMTEVAMATGCSLEEMVVLRDRLKALRQRLDAA